MTEKWCARCKEVFPIAKEPAQWRMGEMRKLTKAPKWIQRLLGGNTGDYLCGNCFYDMLDEEDEEGEG
jgi:ribosomal protein L34E